MKIAALSEELHEVKHESSLDGLTRVYNRSAFDRTFLRLHRIGALSAQPSCLLMTDLDDLKQINDQYGHRSGDEALRLFADFLVRSFPRRSDFIARYGGDEFVAILPQTRVGQSERLARRFLEGIRRLERLARWPELLDDRLDRTGGAEARRGRRRVARTGRPSAVPGEVERPRPACDRAVGLTSRPRRQPGHAILRPVMVTNGPGPSPSLVARRSPGQPHGSRRPGARLRRWAARSVRERQ